MLLKIIRPQIICGILWFALLFGCGDSQKKAETNTPPPPPPVKIESEKDYIASTQKIGSSKDPVYIKEFLKNPDKFKGVRMNIVGKIMNIEESKEGTAIQMYVNNQYDTVLVFYPRTVKVYDRDIVRVYGEGAGSIEGKNRMGAMMRWPVVAAKYVKKVAED